MHVVATYDVGAFASAQARVLADMTGRTVGEARARLDGAVDGPVVLSHHGEYQDACRARAQIHNAGFPAFLVDAAQLAFERHTIEARSYAIEAGTLVLVSRHDERFELRFGAVELLLHATQSERRTMRDVHRDFHGRPQVDERRTMITKREQKARRTREFENNSAVLHIYAAGMPTFRLDQNCLLHDATSGPLYPSRAANFEQMVQTLRSRCANASYDARLLRRPALRKLLGPALDPVEHLFVATGVLSTFLALARQR